MAMEESQLYLGTLRMSPRRPCLRIMQNLAVDLGSPSAGLQFPFSGHLQGLPCQKRPVWTQEALLKMEIGLT